jgi:hypothetical protein
MNLGPHFIIRNTFILHLHCFLLVALFYFENTKIFNFLICIQNTKNNHYLYNFYLVILSRLVYYLFYYYLCYLLMRNLVLDNHTMKLGTQDIYLLAGLLKEERREILFPSSFSRVRYKPSSHPCEEDTFCCNTLHLEPQRIKIFLALLVAVITHHHPWCTRCLPWCPTCSRHRR